MKEKKKKKKKRDFFFNRMRKAGKGEREWQRMSEQSRKKKKKVKYKVERKRLSLNKNQITPNPPDPIRKKIFDDHFSLFFFMARVSHGLWPLPPPSQKILYGNQGSQSDARVFGFCFIKKKGNIENKKYLFKQKK